MTGDIEECKFVATFNWAGFRRITAMADREGCDEADLICKAITTYDVLSEQVAAGSTVVLRHADGTETEVTGIGGKP